MYGLRHTPTGCLRRSEGARSVQQGLRCRRWHDEVREAGPPRGLGLPGHGEGVGDQCTPGRRHRLPRHRTGLRRLRLWRVDFGDAGALYEPGLTGIPIVNVNNNCSTGSTALFMAAQAIRGGLAECTIALGFEKMKPGSLASTYDDRTQPMDKHIMAMAEISEVLFPPAPWMFGAAGREHMKQYGSTAEHFAKIGYKNHLHSVNNPYAQFQESYTLDDILASRMIYDPLTKLQCSPTSDGSGAAILASEAFVDKHGLAGQAVEIVGQAMTTDFANSFDGTCKGLIGYHMNVQAAQRVYDQSGLGPTDFQVIELHDCFSANELLLYEALGLCAEGEAPKLIDNGDTTYGGHWVVNPSGGLISKGHPLGATGLAQCAELTWQLRGAADNRQVDDVTAALQHNIGLGGAAVVTAYQRAER